jgi:tetratricopeptide (TPR) repeat protein
MALKQRDWPSLIRFRDLEEESNIAAEAIDSIIEDADDWSRAALCLLWRDDPDSALVLFEKSGDKAGQSRALNQQGLRAAEEGWPDKAERTLWTAFDRAGEAGDTAAANAAFSSAVSKFYDPMPYLLERDPAARTGGQLTVPQLLTAAGQLDTAAQQYLEEADYHFEQVETMAMKLKDPRAADLSLLRRRFVAPADSVSDSILLRDRREDRERLVMYLDRAANAGYYTGTDEWCDNFLEELRGCAELGWAGILKYGANRQYRACRRVLRDRMAKLDPLRKRSEYLSAVRELLAAYAGLQAAPDAAAELERIQVLFQGRAYRGLEADQRQGFYEAAAAALGGDTLRSAQLVRFDWVGFGNRSYRIAGEGSGSAAYIIDDIIYKPDAKFEISGNLLAPRLAVRTRFDYLPVRAPGWSRRSLEAVCDLAARWRKDLPWEHGTSLRLALLETALRIELGQYIAGEQISAIPAGKSDPWAAAVQTMLGAEIDDHFGRIKKSLAGYDQARMSADKLSGNGYLRGCIEGGAGNVCLALSDTGQARIRFSRVEREVRSRRDLKSLAGRLAISQGSLELLAAGMSGLKQPLAQARDKFDQAVRLGSDYDDPSVVLGARIDRAIADHLLGRTPASREEIGLVIADARREEKPELEASALMVDALLALAAADYDRARTSAEAGVVFYRESGDRYALSNALGLLGVALKRLSRPEPALEKLAESLDLFETMRREAGADALANFTEANLDRYGEIVDLLAKLGRSEEAFGYAERSQAKSLMDAFDLAKIAPADSNLGSALKRAQALRSEAREVEDNLAAELGQDSEDRDPKAVSRRDSTLAHTKSEFLSAESDIRRLNPDYEALIRVTPGQLAKLQRILPASAAVIEYYSSASALYIFGITSDSFRCRSVAVSRDSLYGLVRKYRALMRETAVSVGAGLGADPIPAWRDDGTKRYRETIRPVKDVSDALYQILLAPVADDLKGRDDAVIVPTGMLAYLPFHALGHEPAGDWKFFIQEKNVSYLTSAELIDIVSRRENLSRPTSLLGFGDPDGTLPSAQKEIEALRTALPSVTVFTLAEATKDRAISLAPDYHVLHCATHARLDPRDPEESYILLAPGPAADGRWFMREIFGATWDKMQLVVLSACETALGEKDPGREVSALSYAFSVAGAPSIVASLWPVYDPSTMKLMQEFYRGLPDGSRSGSLRRAQLGLLEDPATAHPFFWAPFVLIGDWR